MCHVSVRELWNGFSPEGFDQGLFVVITGYIDESYSGESPPACLA